jgi:hypothetical protein
VKSFTMVSAVLTIVMISCFYTGKAHAIPAFARQYKTECNTCHTVFPDRNPFGEAFRRNSYVWPGQLSEQKQQEAKFTTEDVKKTAKEWLVTIPELVPVAFWVQHDVIWNKNRYDDSGKKMPQFDLDGETEFEVFTAGSFRDKAGWWAEYNFAPDNELGETYIQFRKPFSLPLNVKAGKFKPQLSLWKPNDSATLSEYGFYGMTVGQSATATTATSGNPFQIGREQGGVEFNSIIGNRVFVAAGMVTPPEKDRNGPDCYGHVSVRFGGTDFNGNAPVIDLDRENIWDNLALTFGTFGYYGSATNVTTDLTVPATSANTDDFYRVGLESDVLFKKLRLRLNGTLGRDNNPQGLGTSEMSRFFMAQGQYLLMKNLIAAMRFEYQDIAAEGIAQRYIPSVTFAPWQNVRLAVEYVDEHTRKVDSDKTVKREATMRISFAY